MHVGLAGGRKEITAFPMEADIPALLRKGGQLDFPRNVPKLGGLRIDAPLPANGPGYYVLSAATRGGGRGLFRKGTYHGLRGMPRRRVRI